MTHLQLYQLVQPKVALKQSCTGGGNLRKSSEWMKNLKWPSKTPEKSLDASHATQLEDSGKKRRKLTK